MAPELLLSLVEDEDGVPCPVTRESDVFSFGCVCLEVCVLPPVSQTFPFPLNAARRRRLPPTTYRTHTAATTVR